MTEMALPSMTGQAASGYRERMEAARSAEARLLEAGRALAAAAGNFDLIDHIEETDPMTPAEREAFLKNEAITSHIAGLTLLLGEITRRTVSPMRRRPHIGRRGGRSGWSVADQVDSELEKHKVNGLIERWSSVPGEQQWLVRMSNGQNASLGSVHQATLFCWGMDSAHQAHREQDHDKDGQQWAYECGRRGMGSQEFWRQRRIRDKYGAAKLAEHLAETGAGS